MKNARQSSSDRTPVDPVDVCVIGAGPAGGLVADSLSRRGHDVVVLEAGPRFSTDERLERLERHQRPAFDGLEVWEMGGERDAFTSSGDVRYPLNDTRIKGVGGTTLHWIGHVPRFHEKDFEMESRYGIGDNWPIGYEDLQPYYADVEREMGVSGREDEPFSPPRDEPFPMDAFDPSRSDRLLSAAAETVGVTTTALPQARNSESYDGRSQCVGYGTCTPVCPSGAKYSGDVHIRKAEANGARVIDRAPAQRLEHGTSGERVESVVYATPEGEEHRQEAEHFVVACGAVETPRLLLLSDSDRYPDGLANDSGTVGRYFMDHPLYIVTGVLDEPTGQHQIGFAPVASAQFYDHEEPSPGSFNLNFLNYAGPSPVTLALESGVWGDDLADRISREYGGHIGTEALVEQLPRADSRVTLDETRTDDHGNPVPDVQWNIGEHAVETAKEALAVQREILREAGARIMWEVDPEQPLSGSHPMGTTRMGTDPDRSVVDERCRTHSLENLSIASSSVFTTGGAMNPSLTIGALALKTADHIHADL